MMTIYVLFLLTFLEITEGRFRFRSDKNDDAVSVSVNADGAIQKRNSIQVDREAPREAHRVRDTVALRSCEGVFCVIDKETPSTIAVVGNGPISEDQMIDLRNRTKWGLVVRINDASSMSAHDFCDMLFLRYDHGHRSINMKGGKTRYENIRVYTMRNNGGRPPAVVLVAAGKPTLSSIEAVISLDKFITLEEADVMRFILSNNLTHLTRTNGYPRGNFQWGWSTGFHTICWLSLKYPDSKLHVFGMNWNGGQNLDLHGPLKRLLSFVGVSRGAEEYGHPFEIERHIVQDVIPHVTVHPTVCSLYAAGGLRKWIACANLVPALVREVICIILCSTVLIVVVFTTVVKSKLLHSG
jgi:hypothetical protein